MNETGFHKYLKAKRILVEKRIRRCLPPATRQPAILHRAMRYSVLAPAKRIRPILCLAACSACGGREEDALDTACAIELIHTYSLIHDDLPSMDDDDYRRGRPTLHKRFGEAVAILAGDALLTLAFALPAADPALKDKQARAVTAAMAEAAGWSGMVGGQVKDLLAEGKTVGRAELESIHARKTGAIITASLLCGGIVAGAGPAKLEILAGYGKAVGLAFQVRDDILDVIGETKRMGKAAGRDKKSGKAAFPALFGLEASRRRLKTLTDRALKAVSPLGARAEPFVRLAEFLAGRET